VIDDLIDPFAPGAICAAVKRIVGLDTMADDFTSAMATDGRQFVNGTLEAVERVSSTCCDYVEGKIVVVTANFASRHNIHPDRISTP
jgi:hypothetical protein